MGSPQSRFCPILFLERVLFLACRWPRSHYILTRHFLRAYAQRENESELSDVSSHKETNLCHQSSAFMTSFNLNYFLRGPISNAVSLGVMTLTHEFWEDTNIQPIIVMDVSSVITLCKIVRSVLLRDSLPFYLWRSKVPCCELAYRKGHVLSKLEWALDNNQQKTKFLSPSAWETECCQQSREFESKSFPRLAAYETTAMVNTLISALCDRSLF